MIVLNSVIQNGMGKGRKRLQDMRANPRGDWTISDVEVVCREYGLGLRKPSGGSHYAVMHKTQTPLTIPAARKIKAVYIRLFVEMVDKVTGAINDD
jgi:hypothetical protein